MTKYSYSVAGSPAQEKFIRDTSLTGSYVATKAALAAAGLDPDPSHLHNGQPYSYGSAWLREKLPADVLAEIKSWSIESCPNKGGMKMARYILVDNNSGYIWGDSADLAGKIFTGSPVEFAAALDAAICGVEGRAYDDIGFAKLALNESGYLVYSVPDLFPVVEDGQDQETIEAVERDCQHVTTIRCIDSAE
jgi:hypothetical protein